VLVAIEGIDGSGKGTQAGRLCETAAAKGYGAASFSFPLYDGNPFSRAIADYLNGEFGAADDVHPELAALLYAGDRFHARPHLLAALEEHDLVVCDPLRSPRMRRTRAESSRALRGGACSTGSRRSNTASSACRGRIWSCCSTRRSRLRASSSDGRLRAGTRRSRADIHEADAGHSGATREVYLELARQDGWRVVSTADEDGAPREVADVAAEVWSSVEPLLR